jgi:hypothetical protein
MWIGLGALLLVAWAAGFLVFKVASVAIHLLVMAAVVSLAVHMYRSFRLRGGTRHRDSLA